MAESPLNPYQAPFAHDPASGGGAGDFSIQRALSDGWNATRNYFPLWLGVGIVGSLCAGAAAITVIGAIVVVPVLVYGGIKFLLNMLDGRAQFNDLFSGFSNYGSVLGRMLLLILLLALIGLASESVLLIGNFTDSGVLQLVGSLIYLGATLFVILPLSFSTFFLVDQNMGATEALGASWRIARGKLGKLLLLTLVEMLIGVLGVLALVVGVIFSMTIAYAMLASAYRQMVANAPDAELSAAMG